ncbi:MAG: thiolase family protein [Verrucomicrobiota bacterium]
MKNLVIIDGVRTPFTKINTALGNCSAVDLGRSAVNALIAKTGIDPVIVDETIFGCVCQPADAANIARIIALRAGIPDSQPALTVHRNCASGLEALATAHARMNTGNGEVFVVGGTESMSQAPLLFKQNTAAKFTTLNRARTTGKKIAAAAAFRPADFLPLVALKLGLTDPVANLNMGETAELLAREWKITRDAQDAFALRSHEKAHAAHDLIADEITPVYFPDRVPPVLADNGPREKQSLEALARLKPVFQKKYGTITAGNASQITDGAVALLVTSEERAHALGLEPLGRLLACRSAGCDPARMGLGPAHAIAKSLELDGLHPDSADIIEINEAFAAQTLAVLKALRSKAFARQSLHHHQPICEIPAENINRQGGAIALGHPVGATGARLVLTALRQLHQNPFARRALVSLCIGGGQGAAAWIEKT